MRLGQELRRLARHSAIYGLGGLVSRILATVLLPLYTHYLPTDAYGRVEIDHRGHRGARDRPPDGDLDRVLPLLLRHVGAGGAADGHPHLVLVHDGDLDARAPARARVRRRRSATGSALGHEPEPRPRRRGRPLGADELQPADGALPRRAAVGPVRDRERRQRPRHGRRDGGLHRRLPLGRDRARRRQLHRHADRVPRARRLPDASSSGSSSTATLFRGMQTLRDAARPVRARALGDQLRRPRVHRLVQGRRARSASTRWR